MNKRFHWVSIQVFLRGEQPRFLNKVLPISYDSFLEEQFFYDDEHKAKVYRLRHAQLRVQEAEGFDEGISVYTFIFHKMRDTNKVFDTITSSLTKEEKSLLHESMFERVDEEGRLSIRLDEQALQENTIKLSTSGRSIQCYFLLAAYPKNVHTIRAATKNLLEGLA